MRKNEGLFLGVLGPILKRTTPDRGMDGGFPYFFNRFSQRKPTIFFIHTTDRQNDFMFFLFASATKIKNALIARTDLKTLVSHEPTKLHRLMIRLRDFHEGLF